MQVPSRSVTVAHTEGNAQHPPVSSLRLAGPSMAVDAPLPAIVQCSATALPQSSSLNKLLNWDVQTQGSQSATPASASVSSTSLSMPISPTLAQHSSSDPPAPVAYVNRPVRVPQTSNDVETSRPSSSLPSSSPPVYTSRPVPSSPVLMPPPPVPPQAGLPPWSNQPFQTTPTSTPGAGSSTTLVTAQPTPSSYGTRINLNPQIAATLQDSDGLYALSKGELEKLVVEVIREEGFVELVSVLHPSTANVC